LAAEILGGVRTYVIGLGGGGGMAYPDVEIEVLVCYRLDVEAYCWYGCDYLADLSWLSAVLLLY
jgi:hypothetical protein